MKPFLVHIIAWIFYFLTLILGATVMDNNFWIQLFCTNAPLIALFYINTIFIFPIYFNKNKYAVLIFFVLLNILFCILLRFVLAMIILSATISDLLDAQLNSMFWVQLRIGILFTGISLAVWYAKMNYEMSMQQQMLRKEVSDAQLLSLRNQINPHFLYNTLSYLYTKALPLSSELSDGIAKLSDMMRYSLDDVLDDGKVLLEKEVKHLDNFIAIHQMRYGHQLNIEFNKNGDMQNHKILPLLLITFVENAFKHGRATDKTNPIRIQLSTTTEGISFSVLNRKLEGIKEKSSGIGLNNIVQRLKLAYPGKHTLTIQDKNQDNYFIDLKLYS